MMTEADLKSHYAAVRARLYGIAPPPVRIAPPRPHRDRQGPPCPRLIPDATQWQAIANRVTIKTGVTYAQMKSERRFPQYMPARFECWYLMHVELGMSFSAIGRKFARDHSTVLHGVRKWAADNGLPLPERDVKPVAEPDGWVKRKGYWEAQR